MIREINIPRGWIGNKALLKILAFDDSSGQVSFSSTPKKERRGRRSQSSSDRARPRTRSESPGGSQSIYETPIKWGAKTLVPKEWKTY